MDKYMLELMEKYEITMTDVERGKGGLFYVDSQRDKIELNDTFKPDGFEIPKHESVSLEECENYFEYAAIAFLMSNAA